MRDFVEQRLGGKSHGGGMRNSPKSRFQPLLLLKWELRLRLHLDDSLQKSEDLAPLQGIFSKDENPYQLLHLLKVEDSSN